MEKDFNRLLIIICTSLYSIYCDFSEAFFRDRNSALLMEQNLEMLAPRSFNVHAGSNLRANALDPTIIGLGSLTNDPSRGRASSR